MRLINYVLVSAAALASAAGSAGAQQIRFAGTTAGCFYGAGPGGGAPNLGASCTPGVGPTVVGSIQFTPGSFSVYTNPSGITGLSYGAVGSNGSAATLGAVTVSPVKFTFLNYFLRLEITFSTPDLTGPGTVPPNSVMKDYRVRGSTGLVAGIGGVNFDPITTAVNPNAGQDAYTGTYDNGQVFGGSLTDGTIDFFNLDNVSMTTGKTGQLSAFFGVESTLTPEPASLALMATGLVGLGGLAVRRRPAVG